jgi:hypothetical protein
MIDKQIEDLVAEDVRRKEILDKLKEEQSKKIHKVLSKVEDNRLRAKQQHEGKVQEIIQTFVEKQKEGGAARQQLEQERKKLFEKRNEEFKKQLQRNHEVIKSNDAKKM